MPITVKCPGCGKALRVRDELAGKKGKCPACGAILEIPAAMDAVSSSSVAATPTAAAKEPRPVAPTEGPASETYRRRKPVALIAGAVVSLIIVAAVAAVWLLRGGGSESTSPAISARTQGTTKEGPERTSAEDTKRPKQELIASAVSFARARQADAFEPIDKVAFDAAVKNPNDRSIQKIMGLLDMPRLEAYFYLVCVGRRFVRKDPIIDRLGEYTTGLAPCAARFLKDYGDKGRFNPNAGGEALEAAADNITPDKMKCVQGLIADEDAPLACDIMLGAAGVFANSNGHFNKQAYNAALDSLTGSAVVSTAKLLGDEKQRPNALFLLLHASSRYVDDKGAFDNKLFHRRLASISARDLQAVTREVQDLELPQALYALLAVGTGNAEPDAPADAEAPAPPGKHVGSESSASKLSVVRTGESSFSVDAGRQTMTPFIGFAFYSTMPPSCGIRAAARRKSSTSLTLTMKR